MFVPLQFNKGNLQRLILNITGVVNSWSAGSTGLTPAAASSGAVVLGGVLNVANGGTGVTTSTGTGSVVLNTSATLVTPAIGVATGTSLVTTGNLETGAFAIIGRNLSPAVGGSTAYAANFFNATAIGVYTGTGSPTISAARGSLYLRNEGLPYYNTNGTTSWAPIEVLTGPTVQNLISGSGATYTTPAGTKWISVRMVGGGGGGGGTGSTTSPTGGTGGNTIFGSVTANGGSGGVGGSTTASGGGGAGGTGGSGTATRRQPGAPGTGATNAASGVAPGVGGSTPLGGAAATVSQTTAGTGAAAAANTGAGGGGANNLSSANATAGGGGAGEYVELIINNPGATYTYTIGAVGAGGIGTGTGAATGGAGGTGFITVTEYYNY